MKYSNLSEEFMKKLPMYKTAYSPLHHVYVGIEKVRYDSFGDPILDCVTANKEAISFRVSELENFCL